MHWQASKHPPATREQWAEWTKFWPLYWNAPSSKGTDAEVPLSSDEAAAARKWMHMALQEAESAHCSPGNAAVIIDPSTGTPLSTSRHGNTDLAPQERDYRRVEGLETSKAQVVIGSL